MTTGPKEELDALHQRGQEALIDFLRTDLDIALTLIQTAKIEASTDTEHCEVALEKSRRALETVLKLSERIEDPTTATEIQSRADQLQAAIVAFGRKSR